MKTSFRINFMKLIVFPFLYIISIFMICFIFTRLFLVDTAEAKPIEMETTEWIGNSHNRESFLVATPFTMTIDGEELHLWYDQNFMVYFNEECTDPFLAPSGNPYLNMNLDGVIGFAEFYDEEDLK